MYGKIFEQIYDGTLSENWQALITFQQMIVLCDADGVVDMTPQAISRRTGIPIEHIITGIEFLEKDDPFSRSPNEDGKRIARLDEHRPWGWYIVNHAKYKSLQDADTVRAQTRERVKRHREMKRTVTDGNAPKRHTDTDTDTDTDKKHSASSDAVEVDGIDFLITKKKRKLSGKRWIAFKRFWEDFDYKRGKREAADAWYDIPELTDLLVDKICCAARCEASRRLGMIKNGKTPKMAQGWISGNRWEDEHKKSESEKEWIV